MLDDSIWKSGAVTSRYLDVMKDSRPFIKEQIEIMLRLIRDLGLPVERFMDLGCGDGVLAAVIWEQYPDATGVLVDHSPPMLQAAREKFQKSSVPIHVCDIDYGQPGWVEAVAQYSPFELIVSGHSIHHQPNSRKREIYAELFALLQPGGMFINVEHVASPSERLERLWEEIRVDALHRFSLQQGLNKSRTEVQSEYRQWPDREANRFTLVETQCNWLREIGYIDVDCFFKYFEFAVFGGCRPRH
ncbi:MAG: class I SAM-dependent methyltransferase [Desulfomonilaceae bacterium]